MNDVIYFISKQTGYSIEQVSKLSKNELAFIIAALEVRANGEETA